jgi:hypothetical protein
MLIALTWEGLVYPEFLPQGQNMNQTVYKSFSMPLRCSSSEMASQTVSDTWLLHFNNTRWPAPLSVTQLLAKHSIPVVPHLPYSLDLAPCNLLLSLFLRIALKRRRYQDIAETQLNITWQLQAILRQVYHRYIEKVKYDWNHCIKPEWSYFEGDKLSNLKVL